MAKLFYVGVVVTLALGLVAPQALASVPDLTYSTTWKSVPGTFMFCPNGDASYLDIEIRDQFNAPMGGVQVDVHVDIPVGDCPDLVCCGPLPSWLPDTTFITDVSGKVPPVYFPCGRHQPGDDTTCCGVVTSTVRCLGVTMFDESLPLTTVDLSQSSGLYVEGLDYSIFALDWLKDRCRSDYNGDGIVEGLDYSIFALHWEHVCP